MTTATRYILVGAHPPSHGSYDGVTFFELPSISISGVAFDAHSGSATREVVERVAHLRQTMAAAETFIAFRYGSTAAGVEEAGEKCGAHLEKWSEVLQRREGCVEFTLKVAAASKMERPSFRDVSSGHDYLTRLHDARSIAMDDNFRLAVEREIGSTARESRWSRRADGGHEFVVLVRFGEGAKLEEGGRRLQGLFPNVPFLLSGPWPLEVFVE